MKHWVKIFTDKKITAFLFAVMTVPFCLIGQALAADDKTALGAPTPWQMGMQGAFSPNRESLMNFHSLLLVIITVIVIVVLGLMLYIMFRFREKANPNPSHLTHNTTLEVVWTLVPVLILLVIAVPSLNLLYFLDRTPNPDMTIKVSAHQWYWSYEYPDNGVKFDSLFAENQEPRQLAVDNPLVLPINTNVRVLVTSGDVMHSWLIPNLGVQIYATPGRTNETWLRITQEGTFYGQCNQICGVNHGFMPIKVVGLSSEKYAAWLAQAKTKFAANEIKSEDKVQQASRTKPVSLLPSTPAQTQISSLDKKAAVVMR